MHGSTEFRNSKYLDVLTALITYLALTNKESRTPRPLAADLSLPPEVVQEALNAFPGIFRKSQNFDGKGAHFYTVHARYAMRGNDPGDEGAELPQVRADILKVVLEFVVGNARSEQARSHLEIQIRAARKNANVAAFVAALAAAISLVGVFITVLLGK